MKNKTSDTRYSIRYKEDFSHGECNLFEKEFVNFITTDKSYHSLLTSDESNAFINILTVLQISAGDEVIISAYSSPPIITALMVLKIKIIFCNITKFLTIDHNKIENLITSKTKAIIPSHIDGMVCDMATIAKISRHYNLHLIEDVTQSLGGVYNYQNVGTFSNFACFSINSSPILSCSEGGIILCNNYDLFYKSFYVHDPLSFFYTKEVPLIENLNQFHPTPMRASELIASNARSQLKHAPILLQQQKKIKQKIIHNMVHSSFPYFIALGDDAIGDCANALNIQLDTFEQVLSLSKKLLKHKFLASPLISRKAHFPWQWNKIFSESMNKNVYEKTLEVATKVLRIPINPTWTSTEIEEISNLLTN